MTRRLNIARPEVLRQLAGELAVMMPRVFDASRFADDLVGDQARELFRADLQRVRYLRIGRFPTLVLHGERESRIAVGYRPVEAVERLLASVERRDAAAGGDETPEPDA
jgi:predicted DsbA family dithiol-disulfide isomerase